jgi:DNA polymerase-3 subunit delta
MVSAAEKAGSSISKDAAQLLAEYCGREPQRMLTEVQKLAAHSPEGITPEDVRSLVAPVTEARVFDLPDKIIARNFTAAMAAINDLVFLRESPVSILSILSMAFVDLYRAGVARKAGIPDAEAKKALGYGGSGYRYDKGAQNQRKFSIPTLERILELLAEADKQMKTTGPDARVVLETTVAEIFREMEGA